MKINKLYILFLQALLLNSLNSYGQSQPHIVLFFVDDMGWADIQHRNLKLHTPNIEQLRKEGMEFTRAYIATPTCSPSRASLLTGKEPARFQMTRHISGGPDDAFSFWETDPVQRPSRNWLPLEEFTYAEGLKQMGYFNYFIGKWHLGHDTYYPVHQGFDAQYGVTDFGHPKSYYPPYFKSGNPFPNTSEDDYLTNVLTEEAERFIHAYDKDQPFMLSFWYYNVHGPHIGRKDWLDRYKAEGLSDKFAEYAAMLSSMDESIGKVRKALADKGILENTLIIFLSDQGGMFDNSPLTGGKRGGNALGEGGARVPMIIRYPKLIQANTSTDLPVQSIDIFPTLMEIASGEKYINAAIQGRSLLPVLKGKSSKKLKKRNLYFFRSYEDQYAAIISGNWKLVKYHGGKMELFNVKQDIGEDENLLGKGFKQEKRLMKALEKWEMEAVPPYDVIPPKSTP